MQSGNEPPEDEPPRPPTNRARCPDADALTDVMRGRDPARVIPACIVKVQAQRGFVILAREAPGGEVAEGAAGGRLYGWQGAGKRDLDRD